MSDVARRAGVSKATVSHVINHTRFVEPETKERVVQAIAELEYRPNAAARSLTTNRTGSIGMVISDATNLFFGEMLRGVEDILRPQNYSLIVCNTDEVLERESHYLDLLLSQPVDGIIAAATSQPWSALAEAEVEHTPIVFVDRAYDPLAEPFVGVNNQQGAYLGSKHLLERGHRQIGMIAGLQRLSTMRERVAGFCQALDEVGVAPNEEWIITCELNIEVARSATRQLLTAPVRPTALFLNNNLLSLGALLAVRDLGLHCPADIALVGFDDHPWAAVSDPPLTVISQPARQVGQVAAQLLFDLLHDHEPQQLRVVLDCELIVRESA
jgi:LacI family transcriptional regulator